MYINVPYSCQIIHCRMKVRGIRLFQKLSSVRYWSFVCCCCAYIMCHLNIIVVQVLFSIWTHDLYNCASISYTVMCSRCHYIQLIKHDHCISVWKFWRILRWSFVLNCQAVHRNHQLVCINENCTQCPYRKCIGRTH